MIGTHNRPARRQGSVDLPTIRLPESMAEFEAEFCVEWQVADGPAAATGFVTPEK